MNAEPPYVDPGTMNALFWALRMDFSPMRPDEWAATDATRWLYYEGLRDAFMKGLDDANAEARDKS